MALSDDEFGSDNDDEEFLAAATQAEAMHYGDFAASPRPSKKRRISRISDQENDDPEPEDDPGYYFPGEMGEDVSVKNSKYKIHIPRNVAPLPDQIFTQTQHGLDEDPTEIRGAIWKRPSSVMTTPNSTLPANSGSRTSVGLNNLNNYFRPQVRSVPPHAQSDDAALAARLQEQENRLARQQSTKAKHQQPRSPIKPPSRVVEELVDLPSDAFSSSMLSDRPLENEVVLISSQPTAVGQQVPRLRGPQTGLKQMTMFGGAATQDLTTSQAAKKRHAWPMKAKDEPPTHHKLDEAAMTTWVYPTNLGTIRDYQFNIVTRSLFHNTLVALPTGLGKTFIAATIMLNYYRWTSEAQIVFMAPTKPLIAQQMEACYQIVGIPRDDTILMTGETSPGHRAAEWLERRVFFMTPQTVINDLKTGICDPKKIALIVVDEAHKATGGYAYTEVVNFLHRFNNSFRVLALTATPGSSVESVQAVINNLGIARVELRTEQSLDIRQYTHEKQTETEIFEFSDEQGRIMEMLSKALKPVLDKVCSQNAYWSRDPMQLTAYGMNMARQKWMASDTGRRAPQALKGMVNSAICVLASLAHNIGLLKFHGIRPFYSGVLEFQKTVDSGQTKGKSATQIAKSEDFIKMMSMVRSWTNNPDFLGHPKIEYLRSVVLNHFLDAGEGRQGVDVPPSATRIMVFVNYRDAAEDICRALKRNEPMIRPHVFVGQANSKGSEGMDQKKQNAVIQDFKSGKYNTLVATSIGEEGLDIGTVDLIVCYDASSSPIRMLQRIGRTGRKRIGRVVLLLMKGKEENDYAKAQDNYSWIQKTIADESRYTYCDDKSPRILPKHAQPVVDKRSIDIPIENTQAIDLNEKNRKGRGKAKIKRPPKKFHMPDGVVTGFMRASNLADADNEDNVTMGKTKPKAKAAKPRARTPSPEPEVVQLPFLQDVLLSSTKRRELEQKYAQTMDVDAEDVIKAPDANKHSDRLRHPDKTKFVRNGNASKVVARTLMSLHNIDNACIDKLKSAFKSSTLRASPAIDKLIVEPMDESTYNDISLDTPVQPPAKSKKVTVSAPKPRGRPRKTPASTTPAQAPRPRGRPKKKTSLQRSISYGSAAAEGCDSSPDPTPADMRLATQGIDLGSRDTDGEDVEDDEQPDSELETFVANSSDPIEMMTSSLPDPSGRPSGRKRGKKNERQTVGYFTSDEEEDKTEREDEKGKGRDPVEIESDDDGGESINWDVDSDLDVDVEGGDEGVDERDGGNDVAGERGKEKEKRGRRRVVVDSDSDE